MEKKIQNGGVVNFEFAHYSYDTDNKEDLSGIDIPQAIQEFVNLLEIKNKKEIIDYTLGLYEKSKL